MNDSNKELLDSFKERFCFDCDKPLLKDQRIDPWTGLHYWRFVCSDCGILYRHINGKLVKWLTMLKTQP